MFDIQREEHVNTRHIPNCLEWRPSISWPGWQQAKPYTKMHPLKSAVGRHDGWDWIIKEVDADG